jgi:TRAP-type C4-dicarboxylate transport system permease small subunit
MHSRDPAGGEPVARLPAVVRVTDRIVGTVAAVARALSALGILAALVLIFYAVVMRYFFNRPPLWIDDTVGYMLVGVVMLGAAATLREGEHISVDMLTGRLHGRARRWAEAWAMASVAAISLMLIVNGWQTAMSSKLLGIMTTGHLEYPIYTLQLLLPLGGLTMLLVALEALLRLALGAPSLALQATPVEGVGRIEDTRDESRP